MSANTAKFDGDEYIPKMSQFNKYHLQTKCLSPVPPQNQRESESPHKFHQVHEATSFDPESKEETRKSKRSQIVKVTIKQISNQSNHPILSMI